MTRAEQRANEKYPLMPEDDKEGLEALKYIGLEFDSADEFNSIASSQQAYFIEGYEQAEKDLADAFIEKACAWLADNARAFDEGDIYNAEDLIEHFRNYIEGE